ncbi:MAG: SCO family protein [Rickettsiales bacterium]|nr:SCO family protein [Rickettsiales bacterium]RPG14896.1 MAG: SCO family protein [Pelagibacteraceae bacterium TMED195]|tara:strand:+ start:1275 stop:1856 length:582 start_codon:yes stop_codon:yes gene_type:complete
MPNYKPLFKKNLLMMTILVFFLLVVIFFINFLYDKKSPSASLGGSFILTDQNGKVFDSKKVNLKKLLYFGYTYCPDICPLDLLKISKIFENNPTLKNEIKPIFISVDPERDTVKKLKIFMENFDKSITALTGTNQEIKNVLRKFKIYVKMNKSSPIDDDYLIDHSSLIFLLDKNDRYIKLFRPNDLKEDLSFN